MLMRKNDFLREPSEPRTGRKRPPRCGVGRLAPSAFLLRPVRSRIHFTGKKWQLERYSYSMSNEREAEQGPGWQTSPSDVPLYSMRLSRLPRPYQPAYSL